MMIFKIVLFLTVLLTALITGFFYAYSCSVNAGLKRLADEGYPRAMQSINKAVLNPLFFISFFGTLITLPLSTWMWYSSEGVSSDFHLLLIATILYIFGVFLITGMGNVPLNRSLEKFDLDTASAQQIKLMRSAFETPWNRFHTIRTLANLTALMCLLWPFINKIG
jgi:uncharacterized membrane protein